MSSLPDCLIIRPLSILKPITGRHRSWRSDVQA
jgi:hypothetical protein